VWFLGVQAKTRRPKGRDPWLRGGGGDDSAAKWSRHIGDHVRVTTAAANKPQRPTSGSLLAACFALGVQVVSQRLMLVSAGTTFVALILPPSLRRSD
jgi:hypothetical protein